MRILSFWALLASALMLAGCGGSSGGLTEREFRGIAFSVLDKTAQPNREYVVIDLSKAEDDPERTAASGVSDAIGAFLAKVGVDVTNVFIAFPPTDGDPRTSGLFSLEEGGDISKDLEDFTDLACVAGVTAVAEGAVPAMAMDATRIANLEAGARRVLETQSVDFEDEASFNAAVARVREITQDGDIPPG